MDHSSCYLVIVIDERTGKRASLFDIIAYDAIKRLERLEYRTLSRIDYIASRELTRNLERGIHG